MCEVFHACGAEGCRQRSNETGSSRKARGSKASLFTSLRALRTVSYSPGVVASDSASLGSFLLLRSLAAAIGEAWRMEVVGGVPRWDFFRDHVEECGVEGLELTFGSHMCISRPP